MVPLPPSAETELQVAHQRIAELEQALAAARAQNAQLQAQWASPAGQLAQAIQRWRARLFPPQSWQLRLLDQVVLKLRRPPVPPPPASTAAAPTDVYTAWVAAHALSPSALAQQREAATALAYRPLLSILTPVYNPPRAAVRAMLASVQAQTYPHWELCLADASTDPAVRALLQDFAQQEPRVRLQTLPQNLGIVGNSNAALQLAHGEFLALLDHDDVLAPEAFFRVVQALNANPQWDMLYSDHDIMAAEGEARTHPLFKPGWSPEILLSANYLTHLTVLRTTLVRALGGFAPNTEGAQDWDLFFRVAEKTAHITHLPQVLYHWRDSAGSTARDIHAKPQVPQTQLRVITQHLQRLGLPAPQAFFDTSGFIRVRWAFDAPLVSIIIPSRGSSPLLETCVNSLLQHTRYPQFEVLILNNGAQPPAAFPYYQQLQADARVRVLHYTEPFNYAAINNFGAQQAQGQVLVFLNNDTEVFTEDWLTELVMWALRPEVGLVGAKLLFPNHTIQHAGVVLGLSGFAGHPFASAAEAQESIFGFAEWYRNFLSVTAACVAVQRNVFEQLQGFNPAFALCGNDVDLGLRAHQHGYRNVYNPFVRLRHHESATHQGHIPAADFRQSLQVYRPWLTHGDPYFNPNLSYWHTQPTLKLGAEPTPLAFAEDFVAQLTG